MSDIVTCPGFLAAGVNSGIKKNGVRDLGLIYSTIDTTAAGVFTTNSIQAAPVLLDMKRIQSGKCRAVVVNSGNANCCTGKKGLDDAIAMAKHAASGLQIPEELVLVASTGIIGEPLPVEKIKSALPGMIKSLSPEGFTDFAKSIMTTDTVPKLVSKQGKINGKNFTVTGVAKGAGMIKPDMATMLCFVCTDISAAPDVLYRALYSATQRSFNKITIDGDTSTNDTVLIMANGKSGAAIEKKSDMNSFQRILDDALLTLAKMLVKDGEGATKLVEIIVKGANTDIDARMIADTVAESNLVKTAFFGEDANWGRIIAAAGRSGAKIDPDHIEIYFNDVLMVKNSTGCGNSAKAMATEVLKKPEFNITIDLNINNGSASVLTCDFSLDYVRINADYRT